MQVDDGDGDEDQVIHPFPLYWQGAGYIFFVTGFTLISLWLGLRRPWTEGTQAAPLMWTKASVYSEELNIKPCMCSSNHTLKWPLRRESQRHKAVQRDGVSLPRTL